MSDTERILSKENLTETMDWLEAVFIILPSDLRPNRFHIAHLLPPR